MIYCVGYNIKERWSMSKRRALITGITGQDGSYLAEYLLDLDYQVFGMMRRHAVPHLENLKNIFDHPNLVLFEGDMTDSISVLDAVEDSSPHEVYNLAAQSFVKTSWIEPHLTNDVNYLGLIRLLEACARVDPRPRIYQASSSEMFGNNPDPMWSMNQYGYNEEDCFHPVSPYGVSKVAAHNIARVYRESYEMFVSCGICFNHESPRRGMEFVTRKIAHGAAQIVKGKLDKIKLGNIRSMRDWGYAKDFVRAMWLMLQADEPDDFVIATGVSRSVGEFLHMALDAAGLEGKVSDFADIDDPDHLRPVELDVLLGDPRKAQAQLGWKPAVDLEKLVKIMVEAELAK
jgi:GDPmannose 4,6-dehydratase